MRKKTHLAEIILKSHNPLAGGVFRQSGNDYHELIPSIAGDELILAERFTQYRRHFLDDLVPGHQAGAVGADDETSDLDDLSEWMTGTFSSAASPGVVSIFFGNEHYATDEEYVFAIAEAMRHEYEAIAAAGATVQLDCPDLAMGRHTAYADLSLDDYRKKVEMNIEALNHGVRNIPAEQVRMHLCWGNYPGPHHCDVALAEIIDIVWKAKPQTVLFEAANPRHAHEWTLFESVKVPDDKVLCPGVIEPQSNWIEHPELVAQRIERYAKLVGAERVMAGVDCGFSIHVGMQGIDPDVAWAKLASLAQGAEIASERLF